MNVLNAPVKKMNKETTITRLASFVLKRGRELGFSRNLLFLFLFSTLTIFAFTMLIFFKKKIFNYPEL